MPTWGYVVLIVGILAVIGVFLGFRLGFRSPKTEEGAANDNVETHPKGTPM